MYSYILYFPIYQEIIYGVWNIEKSVELSAQRAMFLHGLIMFLRSTNTHYSKESLKATSIRQLLQEKG